VRFPLSQAQPISQNRLTPVFCWPELAVREQRHR
jgi:hypothetical protein